MPQHGARVQSILIPMMIAGAVLHTGATVIMPRTPQQVADLAPTGPARKLHPSVRTLRRWKRHYEKYGETPLETEAADKASGRQRWKRSSIVTV